MDLTDAQWAFLEPLFRPRRREDGRGRPWQDTRAVLNGVLWVLRTGAPWHDLPPRYPPYQTCHRRFQLWQRSGRLELLLQRLAEDLRDDCGTPAGSTVHAGWPSAPSRAPTLEDRTALRVAPQLASSPSRAANVMSTTSCACCISLAPEFSSGMYEMTSREREGPRTPEGSRCGCRRTLSDAAGLNLWQPRTPRDLRSLPQCTGHRHGLCLHPRVRVPRRRGETGRRCLRTRVRG